MCGGAVDGARDRDQNHRFGCRRWRRYQVYGVSILLGLEKVFSVNVAFMNKWFNDSDCGLVWCLVVGFYLARVDGFRGVPGA